MSFEYLQRLNATFPNIIEVWLIGSRANHKESPDSDWDYIVFGDRKLLEEMRSSPDLSELGIDLMVVYNGNNFEEPWGKMPKRGSLQGWKWQRISDVHAQYIGKKWKDDESGVETRKENAVRVWPST